MTRPSGSPAFSDANCEEGARIPAQHASDGRFYDLYIGARERSIAVLEHLLPRTWTFYPERLDIDTVLRGCSSVLDLGCGPLSILRKSRSAEYRVGADIFRDYLLESRRSGTHNDFVMCDLTRPCFRPKSFDAVIALEVLEHMTMEQGTELMRCMESVARNRVVVTTPNGFVEQEEYEGNPYQEHRSFWVPGDLRSLGYEVVGLNGVRALRGHLGRVIFKPKVFGEWVSFLSQAAVQERPEKAFQLMGIKELKGP